MCSVYFYIRCKWLGYLQYSKFCINVRSNLAIHLSDTPFAIRQPIQKPRLLERVYKLIRTPHWCRDRTYIYYFRLYLSLIYHYTLSIPGYGNIEVLTSKNRMNAITFLSFYFYSKNGTRLQF